MGLAPHFEAPDENLRHLLGVHVLDDGGVGRRSHRADDGQHVVLLDHLAMLLDGPRRAVAVIEGDEPDLAAVHAALLIDHRVVGGLHPALRAVRRQRAAIRIGLTDDDFSIVRARVVFALRQRGAGAQHQRNRHNGRV